MIYLSTTWRANQVCSIANSQCKGVDSPPVFSYEMAGVLFFLLIARTVELWAGLIK